MDNPRSCSDVVHKQFQKKNLLFGLVNEKPSAFGTAQDGQFRVLYIIYRIFAAAFWMVVQITTGNKLRDHIFFTTWTCTIVASSSYLQLISSLHSFNLHYKIPHKQLDSTSSSREKIPSRIMSIFFMMNWIFYYLAFDFSLMVVIGYWSLLYNGELLEVMGVILHAGNGIYVMIDMFITGIPFKLLHVYIACITQLAYGITTVIVCATAEYCRIYPFLDYSYHPVSAFFFALGAIFIGQPIIHMFGFCMYWLRVCVYSRVCRSNKTGEDLAPVYALSQLELTNDINF